MAGEYVDNWMEASKNLAEKSAEFAKQWAEIDAQIHTVEPLTDEQEVAIGAYLLSATGAMDLINTITTELSQFIKKIG